MPQFDAPERLINAVASAITMVGPDHDGARNEGHTVNAVRAADVMLKRAGLKWSDVGQALVQREKLLAAAKQLQTERDALRAENERLNRLRRDNDGGTLAQAPWVDTGTPRTIESRHAEWLLGLGRYFTERETDFLNSCARRRGRLSPAQRDWLTDLVRDTVARTGQAPPP
jgi:hypothetical protein